MDFVNSGIEDGIWLLVCLEISAKNVGAWRVKDRVLRSHANEKDNSLIATKK